MSVLKSAASTRSARIGVALVVAGAAVVAVASPSSALGTVTTLSAYTGPSGGLNSLTITSATPKFATGNYVNFQYSATTTAPLATTCTATYQDASALTDVATVAGITGSVTVAPAKVFTSSKLVVTVPAAVAVPPTAATAGVASINFTVCVYSGNTFTDATHGSPLLTYSVAKYGVAAAPTITSISPAGGPALGGGTVTITGTNFITGMAATLDGQALTSPSVVSSTTFTGVVPSNTAGVVTLRATTTGGAVNLSNAFTYSDGLIITPSTAPSTLAGVPLATDLDVSGVGFVTKFGANPNTSGTSLVLSDSATAHVYLVSGAYNPTANANGDKTNGEQTECASVLVIGDTELICTVTPLVVNMPGRSIPTVTVTTTSAASSTNDFKTTDIGAVITGGSIPANTTISGVATDGSTATLSASGTGASATVMVHLHRTPTASRTVLSTTAVGTALTGTTFVTSEVGAKITGTGIPAGTTIVSVGGATALVLSAAATGTATGTVTIGGVLPTPDGTYTLSVVGDGSVGALTTAGRVPSIISSGSTFTVAAY